LVRIRSFSMTDLPTQLSPMWARASSLVLSNGSLEALTTDCPAHLLAAQSRHKLVTHAVNCSEVYRIPRVFLQLLPQLQNVIVNRAGGRIVLVAPDFI
jgi:hypothetical protein